MAKTNIPIKTTHVTHEGAPARRIDAESQLRRTLMSCLLWEKSFYEDGESVAERIVRLVPLVKPSVVFDMAIEARSKMNLRHAPLLIAREMARLPEHRAYVSDLLFNIIQRADELSEFVSMYWKDGKQPLSAQVKKGLARAFPKFSQYQIAKYNRDGHVKLRDVLFLSHPKAKDAEQQIVWNKLVDGTLEAPETWEVLLSAGKDKKETWEKLLSENKLGAMALLRNLRNMQSVSVDESIIKDSIVKMKTDRILPYRFIAADRYAPKFESQIEEAMLRCLDTQEKMSGHTVLLVDVSGSMSWALSEKSDMTRMDAACGLAILLREICEKVDIFSFSMNLVQIPPRRGFALRDAIMNSQEHSGTPLGLAVKSIYADKSFNVDEATFGYNRRSVNYSGQAISPDRLIVITDEQSADAVPNPSGTGYMINVSSSQNGVGYGPWIHVDGFSEAIVKYIQQYENAIGLGLL